ncbi:MAG: IS982 family transposase [Chloroflexi bacterium]|nr:IS982 family transposase [Chloroflexota bacterium]NOG66550.1 IS982 family transposase [Chloroflexota bacterium]GIK54337.1 MAG: hypothetical protein BroJett014_33100 [Planctomycetota bacterium]
MISIDLETLLTILYVWIDDWYKAYGQVWMGKKAGRQAVFKDSEMLTLMIAQEYIPYPAERQYVGFMRANYRDLFPCLVDQSQFNRRARALGPVLEALRQAWLVEMGVGQGQDYLLDTKPVPVMGYKRSKKHSDFAGSAAYGYCASRQLHYFGYKLVMITTLEGVPVVYDLVPANTDERRAADAVLDKLTHAHVIADKGFLGLAWQAEVQAQTGNRVTTPKRANQHAQHPDGLEPLLNALRERIEGVFHELQHTGRPLEHLLAKTVLGLATRLIAKVTAHLLRYWLRLQYGIDVQSFLWPAHRAF